uniref:isoleucine--tRNA ligase n=1 Tax=Cyprinus carpio TaxID=7962 RepID=A0A8C1VKT8_CYPCA
AHSHTQTHSHTHRHTHTHTHTLTQYHDEYEIDKALNIRGLEDVAKMGIAEYNKQCRSIVMRYTLVRRMDHWIDFRNDYKTLYPWFMESVWWVLKQLYDKGLVYRGVKVMPFSTACNTPLSNFEAQQNYKDVQDPSVIVSFPLLEDEAVSFLACTTTPWTLPSNLALCVISPLCLSDNSSQKMYIMMEARLVALFKSHSEYTWTGEFSGNTLKGKKYKPLFEYFIKLSISGAFSVVVDNYVSDDDSTGVVHQAPYFGADDYRVCMDYNIIQRDSAPICPWTHLDADKNIIKWLKDNGPLVSSSSFKHSYPFCWRSDTPLIYKAVPSWFVRVEHMVEKLLDNNRKCYWYGESVCDLCADQSHMFTARVTDDYEEVVCVGSTAELEELTGAKVSDLHREFEDAFPADFIAEGIDQTRGWFYTLLVLSTALFGKPPFKNMIVNGLVLKMSKQKKNYPDPGLIVQNHGADALRLYLISSPVVRAENLRFKEEGVRDVLKDVFLPWYNAYRFLVQNFLYNESTASVSDNIMDKWIQSFTQSLIQFFRDEMGDYTVVPKLVKFMDMLTNWYVRMNRRRLKGESGTEDCMRALETLFSVLFSMCRLMGPFTPFITELMYQNLRHLIDPASVEEKDTGSIHYLMLPHVRYTLVICFIFWSTLGHVIRDRKTLPVKYLLKEVLVIHQDPEVLRDIQSLQKYILEELNVRQLTLSTDKEKFSIRLRAEPDHMVLGKRLKGLKSEELEIFQRTGSIVVDGHELRLMYSGTPSQYEAHSDAQVLVLLDVSPDQSMLDEGVSREVINRMTCSKPGHLVPSDEITVYYSSQPVEEYLDKVIQAHTDFIFRAVVSRAPLTTTACAYVNLRVTLKDKQQEGVVLLENPKHDNTLDVERLKTVCCSVFGINGVPVTIFSGTTGLNTETDLMSLSGKTLTVTSGSSPADVSSSDSLLCPYVNMQLMNASPAGEFHSSYTSHSFH